MKLPKQWRHWCRKAGLRPEARIARYNRSTSAWMSLNGQGRKWRIALRDQYPLVEEDCVFQAGDTYEDFDRWALSERCSFEIPQTWAEFKRAMDVARNWKPAQDE